MKKIKILCTVFALSSLLLIPQKTYATEIVTENNTEVTTNYDNKVEQISLTDEQASVDNSTEQSTENDTTYGWVNITGTVSNCSFANEFKLKFKFVNTKNNESFEKEVSSLNNFSSTVKLDYGTYTVSLENSNYKDNVSFEKEVTVKDNETIFNINVKDINASDAVEDTEASEKTTNTNTGLELLKNNVIFLVLILACGGYLLYKEVQRRRG